MKKYSEILFDLDGTLTDPGVGITKSVAYALQKYGIIVKDLSCLYSFIGPPLITSFKESYGFTDETARKAVEYYREYYRVMGMFENELYEGIPELLSSLKNKGLRLVLATSKPEPFAIKILKYFDLLKYFDFIAGSTLEEKRTDKDEVIAYALENSPIKDKSSTIMVGDRSYDILGAEKNGIASIGVLYGYGSAEELENASFIAESPNDIERLLV